MKMQGSCNTAIINNLIIESIINNLTVIVLQCLNAVLKYRKDISFFVQTSHKQQDIRPNTCILFLQCQSEKAH